MSDLSDWNPDPLLTGTNAEVRDRLQQRDQGDPADDQGDDDTDQPTEP